MARPLRLEYPGALYHVTSRGNARARIYTDDEDHRRFLDLLGAVCERHNWRIHAYCLMGNHYHVVLETPEPTLSKGMRQLNGVYTQDFNRRHRKSGHLLQGRYTAIVVDKDKYLLELARYVVLNPVRAGMVKSPGQWPWSSYRATIGKAPTPPWLNIDFLLAQLSSRKGDARERYVRFVAEGKEQPTIWQNLRGQIYLGDEAFVKKLHQRHRPDDRLKEIPRAQRRAPAKPLAHYVRLPDTEQGMQSAYASGAYTLAQIAEHFGVHYSTVSRAVGRRKGA
jgi:REP element-mobilizing transposase RayT